MKIQIVGVPSGNAPKWIRKEWIGCIFEIAVGVTGIPMNKVNVGGYLVSRRRAIETLRQRSPKTARWWEENINPLKKQFFFSKKFCKILS